MYLAGIEAGGTKFVCGISDMNCNVITQVSFPTTTPIETLERVVKFFSQFKKESILALGVACFGPIIINKEDANHGKITSTPKTAWKNFHILKYLKNYFSCPIEINTDVNGSAYGEFSYGAGKGCRDLVYFTVGTGIGAGIIVNKKVAKASEVGHMFLKKHPEDHYKGRCPYHFDQCLEGLAAGPAIEERWEVASGKELDNNHIAWEIEAYYLAQAIVSVNTILSPDKFILGGGVMGQKHMLSLIKNFVIELDNGYFIDEAKKNNIDDFIVLPKIHEISGLIGSLAFAKDLLI